MSDVVSALPRSRAAVRQAWVERLDRFAAASLPVVDFCRREGVSAQAFYYWRAKLTADTIADTASESAAGPRLLPVRILPPAAPVEVVLSSGAVLRLAPGCDLDFVRSLVAALGDAPC